MRLPVEDWAMQTCANDSGALLVALFAAAFAPQNVVAGLYGRDRLSAAVG